MTNRPAFSFEHPANANAAAMIKSCAGCSTTPESIADAMQWHGFGKFDRGGRRAYLCPACRERLESYFASNGEFRGHVANHGDTVSCECELHFGDYTASGKVRLELLNKAWLPTRDCTTECEFKTPIWSDMRQLKVFRDTLDSLIANGDVEIWPDDGAHINVGRRNKSEMAELVTFLECNGNIYHMVFDPISRMLENYADRTYALFGRTFDDTEYAESTCGKWHYDKYNWINIQHESHIEYRLAKYRNAKQYTECIKFCRECNKAMFTWLIVRKRKYGKINPESCIKQIEKKFFEISGKLL